MLVLSILSLLVLYLTTSYIGNHFEYKKVYWFFELAHFLGGFLTAFFLSIFFQDIRTILIGVFFIGFFWELEEFIVNKSEWIKSFMAKRNIRQGPFTIPDTLLDLFLDVLGAFIFIKLFV
jgi:hypothetical protein